MIISRHSSCPPYQTYIRIFTYCRNYIVNIKCLCSQTRAINVKCFSYIELYFYLRKFKRDKYLSVVYAYVFKTSFKSDTHLLHNLPLV